MRYLTVLAIGYILIAWIQYRGWNYVDPLLCSTVAYLVYFSFLSAFLWLNVINFELWSSFQFVFSTAQNNRYYLNSQLVVESLF